MNPWVLEERPEMVKVPIDPEIYDEHLAQIAKILYKGFCQLDPRFIKTKFQPIAIPTQSNSRTVNKELSYD